MLLREKDRDLFFFRFKISWILRISHFKFFVILLWKNRILNFSSVFNLVKLCFEITFIKVLFIFDRLEWFHEKLTELVSLKNTLLLLLIFDELLLSNLQFLSIVLYQTCFFIEYFRILSHLEIVHYVLNLVLGYSEIPSSGSLLSYLKGSPLRVLNLHQICIRIYKLSIGIFFCILSLLNISHFYKSLLSLLFIEYYNSQNITKFIENGK